MVQQQAFQQQQMVVGYVPKYVEVDVPTYETVQVVNEVPMQQVRSMMKTHACLCTSCTQGVLPVSL